MNSQQIIYQVDAFTTKPFKGNPAGVCLLDHVPSVEWMQNIAMEMNLSETAFVFSSDGKRLIRFYTPEAEIGLCGHATLSASHIMFEQGFAPADQTLVLSSKVGDLMIKKDGDWITMNFPAFSYKKMEITPEFRNITAMDAVELYEAGEGWTLAVMNSESEVRNAVPDLARMKHSKYGDMIITAPSDDSRYDFCVRCFAPALGIAEDPVTGSAHCALTPYWSNRTGKRSFVSHQVSKREGVLRVSLEGERVNVSGQALTILKAELYV